MRELGELEFSPRPLSVSVMQTRLSISAFGFTLTLAPLTLAQILLQRINGSKLGPGGEFGTAL